MPSIVLDRHRQEAKRLRRAFAAGDADAVRRVRAVLGDAAPPYAAPLPHAGALHVIAREQGHASWPRLKLALETAAMDRAQRAERLARALHLGQDWVVRALLDADPDLAHASLGLEVALYEVEAVRARLARDPAAATAPAAGGRPPIAHLCFSRHHRQAPERHEAMLAIAQLLVDHGADANARVPSGSGSGEQLSLLYGALGHAGNLPLARWLLERGADPNDSESLYHATELGHPDGVALLLAYGADPRHTNALLRAIDMDDAAMVRLVLAHGADPDDPFARGSDGRRTPTPPALVHAARRFASGEVVELLLEHGAAPERVWQGRDAYGTARMHGAEAVARALEARGHGRPLDAVEAALAACAAGAAPAAAATWDPATLSPDDRTLPPRLAARPGSLAALRALFAAGLDPWHPDDQGMPPLHVALWEGLTDHVAFLLTLPHDLAYRNAYGGDALSTLMHGAEFCPSPDRDHLACARLLLDAGAVPDPEEVDACGDEAIVELLRDHRGGRVAGGAPTAGLASS